MSDPAVPSRRYLTIVVASLSLIVLSCVAFLVPVPYVTMSPGPAYNTLGEFDDEPMFRFEEDVKTYPTKGSLIFLTVLVTRPEADMSLATAVEAFFTDDTAVVPRSVVYPAGESNREAKRKSKADLTGSEDASRLAALRVTGYKPSESATIASVQDDGAAHMILRKGDKIRGVDGRRTPTSAAVVESIGRVDPGDTVTLDITRDFQQKRVEIVTRKNPKNAKKALIGVTLGQALDLPVAFGSNFPGRVGGSSAGLMFALALYDQLTPGSLTGGQKIAGTGKISADGLVGQIGGIQQKIAGAAKANATVLLVPELNCGQATEVDDHGLRLVKVSTLKGAIDALEALAKDPKASVPSCK